MLIVVHRFQYGARPDLGAGVMRPATTVTLMVGAGRVDGVHIVCIVDMNLQRVDTDDGSCQYCENDKSSDGDEDLPYSSCSCLIFQRYWNLCG
jgi:hypothetical protein